jgi:hypothetical protein
MSWSVNGVNFDTNWGRHVHTLTNADGEHRCECVLQVPPWGGAA